MSRIKGTSITLINNVKMGTDSFGHPVYSESRTKVDNVLISPATTEDKADALNLFGKKAVYNIAIPKGDTHIWKDQKVEFFGEMWRVVGFPKQGIEENLPLSWNQIWMVTLYE